MTAARAVTFLLVAVEAGALAQLHGVRAFVPVALALGVVGASRRIQLPLSRDREIVYSLALALPFALTALRARGATDVGSPFLTPAVSVAFAQYFVLLQLAQLFLKREGDVSPRVPLYAVLAMVCAGNVMADALQDLAYQVFALVCVALIGLFCMVTGRAKRGAPTCPSPTRWLWSGGLLLCGLALAAAAGATARHYSAQLNQLEMILAGRLIDRMPLPLGRTGFGDEMRLGSVRRLKIGPLENRPALRIFSAEHPGYLRAKAYDLYTASHWESAAARQKLAPADSSPAGLGTPPPGCNAFALRPGVANAATWSHFDIWPSPSIEEGLFLPLQTSVLTLPAGSLDLDDNLVAESAELLAGVNYTAHVAQPVGREPLSEDKRERHLALPGDLDPRVETLAEEVFTGCDTADEKIAAVVRHFVSNYEYSLNIDIPAGEDPLTHFLLERPPAYCEYFAAGAAVLLRLGGVPTRYVAGTVPGERNPYGSYWVARHKDAHAWCEAYDESKGWVVVEATPPSGVPSANQRAAAGALWDYLKFRRQEFGVLLQTQGLRGLARWAAGRLRGVWLVLLSLSPFGVIVKLALVALLGLAIRKRLKRRSPRAAEDPVLAQLHSLLSVVEGRLSKHEIVRGAPETPHQFAQRLETQDPEGIDVRAAAEWYRAYASVRYCGRVTGAAIAQLTRLSTALLAGPPSLPGGPEGLSQHPEGAE